MVIQEADKNAVCCWESYERNHVFYSTLCAVATDSDPSIFLCAGPERTVVEEGRRGESF